MSWLLTGSSKQIKKHFLAKIISIFPLLVSCFIVLESIASSSSPPSRSYRYLRALPCQGKYLPGGVYSEYLRAMRLKTEVQIEDGYVKAERDTLPAFYFGPERMVVEDPRRPIVPVIPGTDPTSAKIVRNLVPVPIRSARDDVVLSLLAAIEFQRLCASSTCPVPEDEDEDATDIPPKNQNQISKLKSGGGSKILPSNTNIFTWNGATITDRDRGVYDNLTPLFTSWLKNPDLRKATFDSMKLKGVSASPYHCLVNSLQTICGLEVTGLIIEVADSPTEESLSLGAAVLFSKKENASEWKLTTQNYRQIVKAERSSKDAKLVDCYMDELLGLHVATQIPVVISESLYSRICIDGLLEKVKDSSPTFFSPDDDEDEDEDDDDSNRTNQDPKTTDLLLTAPFFESEKGLKSWNKQLDQSRARPAKVVPKLSEISDATTFLNMRISEKRACLRASGMISLPRPREGPKKVDAIMIPLLDEEVAYEVLRRLGETKGDFVMASKMQDFESRKPALARMCREAQKAGDTQRAKELCDEMNSLATLRYNPSNPDEEVTKDGFDIEEWYWQERKRVYGIIA